MVDETEEERTAQDFIGLADAVKRINEELARETPNEDDPTLLDRAVRHIEIMLAKDHIINSGEDLAGFEAAVKRGRKVIEG